MSARPLLLQVKPSIVHWPEGAAGRRDFTVTLSAAPEQGVLTAWLSSPTGGAVLHPAAAAVQVAVDSPVVSFTTNLVSACLLSSLECVSVPLSVACHCQLLGSL